MHAARFHSSLSLSFFAPGFACVPAINSEINLNADNRYFKGWQKKN